MEKSMYVQNLFGRSKILSNEEKIKRMYENFEKYLSEFDFEKNLCAFGEPLDDKTVIVRNFKATPFNFEKVVVGIITNNLYEVCTERETKVETKMWEILDAYYKRNCHFVYISKAHHRVWEKDDLYSDDLVFEFL